MATKACRLTIRSSLRRCITRLNSGVRAHMRIFQLVLIGSFTLLAGCSSLPKEQRQKISWLEGTWQVPGVESCSAQPRNIHFAPVRSKLYVRYPRGSQTIDGENFKKKWIYLVLSATEDRVRLALQGESRVDASGLPVTWDLRKISPDKFCWRRSDWPFDECTIASTRCGL